MKMKIQITEDELFNFFFLESSADQFPSKEYRKLKGFTPIPKETPGSGDFTGEFYQIFK